jgi:hypothetical protein
MTVQTIVFSDASRIIAGVVLITIVTIEIGGWFLTKIARGDVPMTEFQKSFARAGHGHAGMLVTLGLVCLVLADGADLSGFLGWWSRVGVPLAAILMSAGFFAASAGKGLTKPNKLIGVLWLGALALATGVVTLGLGLLTT